MVLLESTLGRVFGVGFERGPRGERRVEGGGWEAEVIEVQVLKKFWLVKSSVMEEIWGFWRFDGFLDARSARKWKNKRRWGGRTAPARAEDEWQELRCNVASLWGPLVVLLLLSGLQAPCGVGCLARASRERREWKSHVRARSFKS